MAISATGSTLSSLPCEALALIASQLQRPDRLSLFSSCLALRQACSLTAHRLVVPGQQLLATCQVLSADAFSSPYSSSSPWDCSCCVGCDECQACLAAGASSAEDEMTASDEEEGADSTEDACSWLQRYSGVRSLTVSSCDSCQRVSAGSGRARSLCLQGPCSPHTPTAYAASNWVGGSSYLDSKPCVSPSAHRPYVSLSSFLAAAGSSMPYLQELDISAACACLDGAPGVLECLTRSCPHLCTLSLPTWLLQPAMQQSSSWYLSGARPGCSFDGPALKLAAATSWDPTLSAAAAFSVFEAASSPAAEPYGLDRLLLHPARQHQSGSRSLPSSPSAQLNRMAASSSLKCFGTQQQQPQPSREHRAGDLGVLAGLSSLTSLELCGAAPPAAALKQLSQLTQLLSFTLFVTDSTPDIPAALSQLPGWQGGGVVVASDTDSDSSTAAASSGAVLGASLALLPGLTSLSLSGALHAADTLKALAVLPGLAQVDLCNLSDFAVGSLANLSGLTGLTSLRVRGCRALQATARSALPLQLQALQELEVLDLDFDLHLRDMQVLCLLKRLTQLSANSFHHCIHLMPTLSLPALRSLSIASVSRLQPQQAPQQVQQQQQQQGPPAGAVYAHVMAGVGAAAAAAPEAPAAVAAVGGEAGNGDGVPVAAAAGIPVVPLSALPVLMDLQQQQQQGEQPPYLLLAAQGGTPALLLLHNQQQQHQQQQQHAQPLAHMLQAYHADAPIHAAGLQAQQQQQHVQQQQHMNQQLGHASGVSLQLLQLRQQQLYLQQQQLRLQQQQVRLQLQQMQSQLVQHANPHAIAAAAAAAGVGQVPPPPPPHAAPQQQQQAAEAVQGAAAGAAGGCMQPRGWLVVLFPGLEELRLTSAKDCAVALPALQGHPSLQKLVIGTAAAGRALPQQQQQQGVASAGLAAGFVVSGAAGGAHSGRISGPSSSSMVFGGQCAGLVAAASRGVSAPWGVLRTMPSLEELEILETATVLGCVFSSLGMAAAGQLVRLVLRGADSLSDFSAATLLGPYAWNKLTRLEIEGAQGLSSRGLNCLAGLPAVQALSLSYCPGISASGLGSFLLSSSSNSLRHVSLLCCPGVSPAEAQTVQDAIWAITRRRVEVSWSRHDPSKA